MLTGFAEKYPERIEKLVYVDEASDPSELAHLDPFAIVPPGLTAQPTRADFRAKYWRFIEGAETWTPALEADMHFGQAVGPSGRIELQLSDSLAASFIRGKAIPDHSRIRAPVLAIFSHGYIWATVSPGQREAARRAWNQERERHAERFRQLVPGAEVVVLDGGAHPLLIQRGNDVVRVARTFLLK